MENIGYKDMYIYSDIKLTLNLWHTGNHSACTCIFVRYVPLLNTSFEVSILVEYKSDGTWKFSENVVKCSNRVKLIHNHRRRFMIWLMQKVSFQTGLH